MSARPLSVSARNPNPKPPKITANRARNPPLSNLPSSSSCTPNTAVRRPIRQNGVMAITRQVTPDVLVLTGEEKDMEDMRMGNSVAGGYLVATGSAEEKKRTSRKGRSDVDRHTRGRPLPEDSTIPATTSTMTPATV